MHWESIYNILTNNGVIHVEYYIRILLSGIIGLLIGFDRSRKSKPAGLKTFTLLSIGSCMVTIISIISVQIFSLPNQTMMDPMRLVAQLLPAVGFVGAGTIWKSRTKVKGLTSAAFVFFTCSIGIGIGVGFYGITIFTFILTFSFIQIESVIEKSKRYNLDEELQDDEEIEME